jgi:transcriptional regulator with XRE-family HTH domain
MSEMAQLGTVVPEWTLGWRMQRALAHAGVSVEQIADETGVSRSTISRWLNDRGAPPRAGYLKLWSLRTGASYEWLRTGYVSPGGEGSRTAPISTLRILRAVAA